MRDVFPELSLEHNRQILDKALKKMRAPFRVKKLDMLEYCEEAMSEIDDKEKNVSNVDILDTLKGQLMDMLAMTKSDLLSIRGIGAGGAEIVIQTCRKSDSILE